MNYPYANGIIKAIENNILDYSKFQNQLVFLKEFIKTLIDLAMAHHMPKPWKN